MNKTAILACSTLASAILLTGTASADGSSQENRSLVGTWQVEVTVRANADDCTTAPPLPPVAPNPFPSLNTFHEGGTMSETGSRSPPSRRSAGHGVWERIGKHRYEARFTFQIFDVNGALSNNMDIRADLQMSKDGNSLTGVSRFAVSDISGNVLNFCATQKGTRFGL